MSRFGCLWGCHVFPSGPASGRSGWVSSQTPSRCFRGRTATTPQEAGPCRAFLAFGHDDEATHMIPGHKGRLGVTQRHHRRVNGCEQSGHCPFASCCLSASCVRCALHWHGHRPVSSATICWAVGRAQMTRVCPTLRPEIRAASLKSVRSAWDILRESPASRCCVFGMRHNLVPGG